MQRDALTGLLGPDALAELGFVGGTTAVVFDIAGMIFLNDHLGHEHGDAVLRAVSRLLTTIADAPNDILLRIGGEEFMWILDATRADDAVTLALNAQACIQAQRLPAGLGTPPRAYITVSAVLLTLRTGEDARSVRERTADAIYAERVRRDLRGAVLVDGRGAGGAPEDKQF